MKLKVKLSEIYHYQSKAEAEMVAIKALYEASIYTMLTQNTLGYRLYLWFRKMFHIPLSLRMYNGYESLMEMDDTSRASFAKERDLWHSYWSVRNQFTQATNEDKEVLLSEYETETILKIRGVNDD